MPFSKNSDCSIFYETKGEGETLILIPGFASGAWSWFWQIEDLAKDFQVVTFDPRGIGKSPVKNENALQNLSMRTFAEDVLRILDDLGIGKSHILGASFGGFVAQEYALLFPERLDKLILACTSSGGVRHIMPDIEVLRSFTPDPNLTLGERVRKFLRPAFTDEFNARHADEVENICRLREANEVAEAVYTAQLEAAFSFDTNDKIKLIENETLVVTGDRDSIVPMRNSLILTEQIPHSSLKIIKNGSHMFFVENAVEFNRAIKEFLKQ